MSEDDLRIALRKHAIRLNANLGRIACYQCGSSFGAGAEEIHQPGCLAAPERERRRRPNDDRELRAMMTAAAIVWPESDPSGETGPKARFSRVEELEIRRDNTVHHTARPEIVTASFVLENGGTAKGAWSGKRWMWLEWSDPS